MDSLAAPKRWFISLVLLKMRFLINLAPEAFELRLFRFLTRIERGGYLFRPEPAVEQNIVADLFKFE